MHPSQRRMGRRTVLAGFGSLGAAGLLAACSSGGDDAEPTPSPGLPSATTPPTTAATGAPTPTPQLPADLDVMIGQMIMLGFRGTEFVPGSAIAENLEEHHIGAVVLFDFDVATSEQGRNITSPEQVAALCAALQAAAGPTPLLISTDQEGGEVQRLGPQNGFPAIPSAAEIGQADDISSARAIAGATSATLAAAG
ncbi:MAG: glycoside hydrolase family 3 N-terminal domain-containing protein, partial [Dehalococcoidia bacterium]